MTIPTDGRLHPTLKNGLNVNLMDAPDFNIDQCEFHTKGPATYVYQKIPSGGGLAHRPVRRRLAADHHGCDVSGDVFEHV